MFQRWIGSVMMTGLISSAIAGDVEISIDFGKRFQTIDNFGASTGMHGSYIANHWSPVRVKRIARLLFSRELDSHGQPEGIGLSAFRIEIGAGTDTPDSGIAQEWRKTRLFLQKDGSYDWEADSSVRFWLNQLREYSVPTAIGYLNSPPVCWTENGLGYRTNEVFSANLKEEHYTDYAKFLAEVAAHFKEFGYIAPVNEPQWFWTFPYGQAKQEGSPWTNEQIARLIRLTDSAFGEAGVKAHLLIPEAATYPPLYESLPSKEYAKASDQINAFWNRQSPQYIGDLSSVAPVVAGHAYFSDVKKDAVQRRDLLLDKIKKTGGGLRFWQTEYSLLGDGWLDGKEQKTLDETHCALFLARMIHWDMTVANAAAWQFWSATEPQHGSAVPRFCLIETDRNGAEQYSETKMLWALGQFSRFVFPGMVRVGAAVRPEKEDSELLVSAYCDFDRPAWATVIINMSSDQKTVRLKLENTPLGVSARRLSGFITDERRNMNPLKTVADELTVPPRSIITVVSR